MNIRFVALILLLVMFCLSGCSISAAGFETTAPNLPDPAAPGKMVEHIDVCFRPDNPSYTRHYCSETNIQDFLTLLRSLQTNTYPDHQPNLLDGQSYFVITLTYSNDMTQEYYLMGHRYLRTGDNQWREIGTDNAAKFIQFLKDHPADICIDQLHTVPKQNLYEVN